MITRRLLYLNTHLLSAYAWRRGRLVAEGSFSATPEDLGRFTAYLEANRRSQFQILANVSEESHQVEIIPYLHGKDRQVVIARKIAQLFFGTPLSTATSLGYEKTKRKNERLLLSALTNPAHFEPWLACLARAEAPMAGVYTLSQLCGRLIKKLHKLPERCLLLTMQDNSIRESYIVNGETLFSRMAPVANSSIAGIAAAFAAEAIKLHQYLVGQRQVSRNDLVPVFVLTHPLAVKAVRTTCIDTGNLVYTILDSHEAATRVGLRTLPQDNRSELLFLHFLAADAPKQQLAAEDFRHDYRILQIKQALLGLGSVAVMASLLFAAKQLHDGYSYGIDASELLAQEQELSRRYEAISATFPKLPVDNEVLRKVTSRFNDLQRVQRQPADAYRLVSRALTAVPEIELEGIEWKISDSGDGRKGPGAAIVMPSSAHELIVVRGTVRPGREMSSRQLLNVFDIFVMGLQADPGIQVEVLQHPVDIESGRVLKGGDNEDEKVKSHSFAIQITRKLAS